MNTSNQIALPEQQTHFKTGRLSSLESKSTKAPRDPYTISNTEDEKISVKQAPSPSEKSRSLNAFCNLRGPDFAKGQGNRRLSKSNHSSGGRTCQIKCSTDLSSSLSILKGYKWGFRSSIYCLAIYTTNWFLCMLEFGCKLLGTHRSHPFVNINNPYETEWYNSVLLGLTHCHKQPTNVSLMVMVPCKKKIKAYQSETERQSLSRTKHSRHPLGKSLRRGCGTSTAIEDIGLWSYGAWNAIGYGVFLQDL